MNGQVLVEDTGCHDPRAGQPAGRVVRPSLWWMVLLTAFALAFSGCGGTSAPSAAGSADTGASSASVEPLRLVYISDSSGWGVAKQYAALAEKELGRDVNFTDLSTGGLTAVAALRRLKANHRAVEQADIIVVAGLGPTESGAVPADDVDRCVTIDPTPQDPPKVYSVADWKKYGDVLQAIYAEIWKLRAGAPTILRGVDHYIPAPDAWRKAGIDKECTADFASESGAIQAATEASGATFVSIYDVLNGPDHQKDPREAGYILEDSGHTTEQGVDVIAATIAAAGFEPNTMPTP
jgi:hypothetical protein